MPINQAVFDDIHPIMTLIGDCIRHMENKGIFQWNDHYPTLKIIASDIESGSMYVLKNGGDLLGMIAINEEQSPEYGQLNWRVRSGKVLVIHRLAIDPKWQKQGIGRQLMDFAENYALENGYASIRLDAYSGNPRALQLYERRGYQKAGQLVFPLRELPFFVYEKVMLKIRRYRESDFDQVWKLHILAMEQIGVYKGDGPWDNDLRNIEKAYFDNNGEFLIGELDYKIIAMGAFKNSGKSLAEIKRMRVHPDFQGMGLGTIVFNELEKRAKSLGYQGFHLETSELQIAARKLYEKCDFREVGRIVIDGFNCILFEKSF